MQKFKNYIGCKIIKATPMTNEEFAEMQDREAPEKMERGYCVVYPDGYTSWSPERAFQAYREVTAAEIKLLQEDMALGEDEDEDESEAEADGNKSGL